MKSYQDRFNYLKLNGIVSSLTFGGHRYLNQVLYRSDRWLNARRKVIMRDNGCDLAHPDMPIGGSIYIHHINPITLDDVIDRNEIIFDLDNLISTSFNTHNAIHYGNEDYTDIFNMAERKPNDTCPWR